MKTSIILVFSLITPLFALTVTQKPNIILIIADDAGYVDYGFMGSKEMHTPNLDNLAKSGITFPQAYVQSTCSPSRAAIMSGLLQQRTGYDRNNGNSMTIKNDGFEAERELIFERLKKLGYTTGVIGKWHVGAVHGYNSPLDQGVDEFFGFLGGGRSYFGIASVNNIKMRRNQKDVSQLWVKEGDSDEYDPKRGRYVTDAISDEAVAFIDRHHNDTKPFFLYVAYNSPHTPLSAKKQDLDHFKKLKGDRKIVAAMNYAMDRGIGKIIQSVDQYNLTGNTIVVFINDNGGSVQHGNSNGKLKGEKGSTYEGGIRSPMIIKGPGFKGQTSYPHPVSSLDFTPTFLSLAGGEVNFPTDGVNLLPYLSGDNKNKPHKFLYFRHVDAVSLRKGDWKVVNPKCPSGYGKKSIKLSPYELYNLKEDPYEKSDLAKKHPEIVKELRRHIVDYETGMPKPRWGRFGRQDRNLANHFTYLAGDQGKKQALWSDKKAWSNLNTKDAKKSYGQRMTSQDGNANSILEFKPHAHFDYTAENNLHSMSGHSFMLNGIHFSGSHSESIARQITLTGNPVMFTNDLEGNAPHIHHDALKTNSLISMNIELYHALKISGKATEPLTLAGGLIEFNPRLKIDKSGDFPLILKSDKNKITGDWNINQGSVHAQGKGSLGIGNMIIEKSATLNADYDITNPKSTLTLNGILILDQNHTFGKVTIKGQSLTPGKYSAKELITQYPDNVAAKGGSITVTSSH